MAGHRLFPSFMKATLKAIGKGAALGLAAVAIVVVISSCGVPLKATYLGEYGAYSYSSKGGFEIQLHATK